MKISLLTKKKKKTWLNADEKAIIEDMRASNATLSEICQETGCSITQVSRYLKGIDKKGDETDLDRKRIDLQIGLLQAQNDLKLKELELKQKEIDVKIGELDNMDLGDDVPTWLQPILAAWLSKTASPQPPQQAIAPVPKEELPKDQKTLTELQPLSSDQMDKVLEHIPPKVLKQIDKGKITQDQAWDYCQKQFEGIEKQHFEQIWEYYKGK